MPNPPPQPPVEAAAVTTFWKEAGPGKWFKKDSDFDEAIRARFLDAHLAASRGEFAGWAATADGALALLLLLDQFPRNIFRGSAHAFATDPLARSITEAAIGAGHDRAVETPLRCFFYLPFEHSERLEDQDRSIELTAWDPDLNKWARIHRDIISRFGRFPHRNAALGRATTPEEQAFLDSGGFAG
jgi:uncharacterized protein (DUF924 family)